VISSAAWTGGADLCRLGPAPLPLQDPGQQLRGALVIGLQREHAAQQPFRRRRILPQKVNTVLYRTEPKAGKSEMLVMTPVEFLRRWTLLMPPPKAMPVPYQELCSSNGQEEPGPLLRRTRAQVTPAAAAGGQGGKRGGPGRPAGENRQGENESRLLGRLPGAGF